MWGSIKVGYKITFGPTDATGRNDASASVRQREQSEAFDKRVEIARLSAELVHSKQLHNQIAIAVEAGHGLHSEFCAWLQLHGLNPNEVGTLASETEMAPGPSLSADEVARFELLWDNLSQR